MRLAVRTFQITFALLNYWFAFLQCRVACSDCGNVGRAGLVVGAITILFALTQWRNGCLCHFMWIAALSGMILNFTLHH